MELERAICTTAVTRQPLVPPDRAEVVTKGEAALLKWVAMRGQNQSS
jgi:hypothetical protein